MVAFSIPSKKTAGLLVPVFALRHARDFGIGDTEAVRETIDFCQRHGFAVLQTLPIHETIGDHSPYNPISSRALSPALLSLSPESVPGLTEETIAKVAPESWLAQLREGPVKHGTVHALKLQLLLTAHRNFRRSNEFPPALHREFAAFQAASADWLPAYTLYRLLVREYEGNPNWTEWRPEHQSLASAEQWLADEIDRIHFDRVREGFAFVQWVAWRQWRMVRSYAEEKNVQFMGEVSFGVSRHSADAWAQPDLFDFEWNMGTPPIVYFDTNKDSERFGQNWGFPPYRWENHRADDFKWLRGRLEYERQFFHICRLDHLRGYFRAYMFPWSGGAQHGEFSKLTEEEILQQTNGRWPRFLPGSGEDPESARQNEKLGRELISTMREAGGKTFLVGEIMGQLPEYMTRVLEDLGVASLTFPQLERNADRSLRASSTYRSLSLAAFANHDHAPLAALYTHLSEQAARHPDSTAATDLRNLLQLAGWKAEPPTEMNADLLAALQAALFSTPCLFAVLMSSDLLGIPQRFNLPGSFGQDTWNDRLEMSLHEYAQHPVFGPRIKQASQLIAQTGRKAIGEQPESSAL